MEQTERKGKGDVLTLDDVSLEIRIGVSMMRARKERTRKARVAAAVATLKAEGVME